MTSGSSRFAQWILIARFSASTTGFISSLNGSRILLGSTIFADGSLGDKYSLPSVVPMDAGTDLVLERSSQRGESPEFLGDAAVDDVGSSLRCLVY